ncbi:MAG: hypothetical protein J6Z30_04790 [Pyramidobacter sp.]|nr:hypothetical protein [Pyramidobacter sp.]
MKKPTVKDIIVFSRITGAALLVCGYLIAGLYLSRWCAARGWPGWTTPHCLLAGLAAALLSGVRELKSILAMLRRDDEEKR